jgi:two-component system chemotaxis response regulator CheB
VSRRDLIVVGASAGGVEALRELVKRLPADIPAAMLVVIHVARAATSSLPAILEDAGPLRAAHARDDEPIESGRIYVAPPDRHLVVLNGRAKIVEWPPISHHRPAIDALFVSAARSAARRTTGVILSGSDHDGTAGSRLLRLAGGVTIAQTPGDARYPSMTKSAIDDGAVDHVLPVKDIADLLVSLAEEAPA